MNKPRERRTADRDLEAHSLEAHVLALRDTLRAGDGGERLGESARLRVRNRVRADSPDRTGNGLEPLFRPMRGLAYASGIALLALVALVGGRQAIAPGASPTVEEGDLIVRDTIRVSKENGQVVFEMAAAKIHRVRKMTRPDGSAVFEEIVNDGRYTDGLESESRLVFYRID